MSDQEHMRIAQQVEAMARASHDEYERVAAVVGWQTNPRSRVPWEELPHDNQIAMVESMRAARDALLPLLSPADLGGERGTTEVVVPMLCTSKPGVWVFPEGENGGARSS